MRGGPTAAPFVGLAGLLRLRLLGVDLDLSSQVLSARHLVMNGRFFTDRGGAYNLRLVVPGKRYSLARLGLDGEGLGDVILLGQLARDGVQRRLSGLRSGEHRQCQGDRRDHQQGDGLSHDLTLLPSV